MTARPTAAMTTVLTGVLAALLLAGCSGARAGGDDPLIVAGASDLMPAFTTIGEAFTAETGIPVTFDFGSSGQLAQQLIEGAPIDVYASANVSFVDLVLSEGVGDPTTQATYAFGRIVIWSPEQTWSSLEALFTDPDVGRVAIANPAHAPYGLAAKEALESAGLWEDVRERLVYGENVSDTQRLAASGNVDAALIALSLATAADERGEGAWTLIDVDLHGPLQQDLIVTATDDRREAARLLADFVTGEEGRAVMRRFGFLLPGETPDGS